MKEHKLILASGSPRRRELMDLVGADYIIISSDKEEDMSGHNPEEMVKMLSKMKADDVFDKLKVKLADNTLDVNYNNSCIIGCDTVVAYEGKILGKPHTPERAFEMIKDFAGKTHYVYTGVCINIIENGEIVKCENFAVSTAVKVSPMTDDEIRTYVASGETLDKAGAYAIQGKFSPFIEGIEGDYYNIVGYPLNAIYSCLNKNGIKILNTKVN